MSEIILVGGGGHCKSCIDVIEAQRRYKIKGIIDLPSEIGKTILDYKVIGNDENLPNLASQGFYFLITLGHMGNAKRRRELFDIIKSNGGKLPAIISPTAVVSRHAKIGEGTIIMHKSMVNVDATIHDNCIINSKALIEHDVVIGDDCHISTNATINGNCTVNDRVFIGSSSTIRNGISIVKDVIVGIGSVVIKDINTKGTYFENPLKKIR